MDNELILTESVQSEIDAKVAELRAANPKLKRVFPIVVEGDVEVGEKEIYVAYFKQPSFSAFSKYMSLSQKDQVGAMRELAKDCYIDGDRELVKEEDLFVFGLMPYLSRIIEVRKGKLANLSKAGK